ncbi:hypothetical protein [uncultured Thiodictyon sp.]|jgi:hypothetical protein|nr:hypothetical protein [uncultured Thiodictyon sp.]
MTELHCLSDYDYDYDYDNDNDNDNDCLRASLVIESLLSDALAFKLLL